ncbi:MAG: archaemetzincin family Zn-dependent metalloprotease [bacterium]
MNLQAINLISFGYFEKGFLDKVAASVAREFHCSLIIKEGHVDLSEYYDPGRRQYNGNSLLKFVDEIPVPESCKTIGLFNVDLFIPILTYVFGQAFLCGRTGIASLYRLNNECYGMKADDALLLERFKKEVIHELGHTFGLKHCHLPSCVMRSSTYVEDIDQKDQLLCSACRIEMGLNP